MSKRFAKTVQSIVAAEAGTSGEIRVHYSRRLFERDPLQRARRLFAFHHMDRTTHRNAVLIYLNIRKGKFCILADEGFVRATGPKYWDDLGALLKDDLLSTHYENAVSITIATIGATLKKYFQARA